MTFSLCSGTYECKRQVRTQPKRAIVAAGTPSGRRACEYPQQRMLSISAKLPCLKRRRNDEAKRLDGAVARIRRYRVTDVLRVTGMQNRVSGLSRSRAKVRRCCPSQIDCRSGGTVLSIIRIDTERIAPIGEPCRRNHSLRLRSGKSPDQPCLISMRLACASGRFASVTVSTPLRKLASTWSALT